MALVARTLNLFILLLVVERNAVTAKDLEFIEYGPNQLRRNIDCTMDGMNVFAFGMSVAPKSVKRLAEKYVLNLEQMDYLFLHQANHYMNEKIRKKLNFAPEKTPYSLRDFGNTSCASIPVTIITQCSKDFATRKLRFYWLCFRCGTSMGKCSFRQIK